MAIILRFVDCDGFIREQFFKVLSVADTCSQTLKDEISKVLTQYDLQVENMRGQGYDGASNMRGEFNGLEALFREEHSALRVIREEEIADLVAAGALETGRSANQTSTLQRAGATRWGSHLRSISSLIKLFGATQTTLANLVANGPNKVQGEAKSVDMSAPYKKSTRACEQNITNEHYYQVNILNAVTDFQLAELDSRFTDNSLELLILSATFDPRDNFRSFKCEDVCNLALRFYPHDFTSYDMLALDMECGYFLADIHKDPRFANTTTVSDLCRRIDNDSVIAEFEVSGSRRVRFS
ncbi:uncharacterized protein LOC133711158 [Rosa rugosa]|uniref:uncharacterized protein LOC133711158 n=1 Tax=Rosa rugosa TaxID=74645 RepID=UPI002B413296|nr:uncharacterized protein LOC133711158 [Rosa rugosa]